MMGEAKAEVQQLERALRAADPRARLVTSRVLRRIIKQEQKLSILGLHHAHRRSLTIGARAALRALGPGELDLPKDALPSALLLLIELPEGKEIARGLPHLLLWGWRRLFHARIHAEFSGLIAAGRLRSEEIESRIDRIGRREFAEIRGVLEVDGWLLAPRDEVATYEEFVAVYLELRYFAESLLPVYFPGIEDFEKVDAVLAQDLDAGRLFRSTRPEGAPDPRPSEDVEARRAPFVAPLSTDEVVLKSEPRYRALLKLADRARGLGNLVRSATLRTRAARLAGPSRAGQASSAAEDDLDALCRRLLAALGLDAPSASWRPALSTILDRTIGVGWTVEARFLYDLQSICIDHERAVYEIDLLGWFISLGKRPLKRPLPNQTLVRMSKHLRRAAARLPHVRIADIERSALANFLAIATEAVEKGLRGRFRPLISSALEKAGLAPRNLPERVSFERMTEELLDLVVERDHLTMGDVRDAVSRSDLRLPDVMDAPESLRNDRILRANRRFAVSLDGVYRRGEFYLRLLQRMSLVAFGTKTGRWLTRYVTLPYGGAFGALVTIEELLGFIKIHVELKHLSYVAILGTFLLLLLHSTRFRERLVGLSRRLGRGVRFALFDGPAWLLNRPAMRALLASNWFDRARRIVLQPLLFAGISYGIVQFFDHDRSVDLAIAGAVFLALAGFLGTRVGRETEEYVADGTMHAWRRLRVDFLPGLFRFVMEVFDAFLESVERVLYAVDEKLRFRSGQGRATLWLKAMAGVAWGVTTYFIRIFINLMVEPTINPVKHFPTVTVAAKMILPKVPTIASGIAHSLGFLGAIPSYAIGWTMVVFIPGLAGFFVWELKENWRLFEANRPKTLRPVMIGHHGETMRQLLVPGFHSGTIPKLFAKLRRASRRAYWSGDWRAARKQREAIHHVELPIRHFVERGLLTYLVESGCFQEGEVGLRDVELATNRVKVVVETGGGTVRIEFEKEARILVTLISELDRVEAMTQDRREILHAAIAGCLACAGAERVVGSSIQWPTTGRESSSPLTITWKDWVAFWESPGVNRSPVQDDHGGLDHAAGQNASSPVEQPRRVVPGPR